MDIILPKKHNIRAVKCLSLDYLTNINYNSNQMSKIIKENFLAKENGCYVVQVSSEREGTSASNILNQNPKSMWIIQKPLPQYCIINTSSLKNYPKVFNRVCFYCWHDYDSNPALIELAYSNNQSEGWNIMAKIRLTQTQQKQYFKIKDIPVTQMKYLRVTILQNFGDKSTYLNQIELGYVKQNGAADSGRQKIFSQFVKLTSTERQLKRALEHIKNLTSDQELLKETVKKQNQLIFKMQEAMKKMTKQIQKMSEMQQMQNEKINRIEGKNNHKNQNSKHNNGKSRQHSKEVSSHSSESDRQEKRFIQDTLINKKTVTSSKNNKSISYIKSNRQSQNKNKDIQFNDSKKATKLRQVLKSREAILDSQLTLSEYNSSQQERSKNSQKCCELMHRLQSLLAEKQKRKRQLIKKSQHQ